MFFNLDQSSYEIENVKVERLVYLTRADNILPAPAANLVTPMTAETNSETFLPRIHVNEFECFLR
jgi:exonuclease I